MKVFIISLITLKFTFFLAVYLIPFESCDYEWQVEITIIMEL
jgi:hypothetical protein